MIEKIAMWGGVAAIVIAVFAIAILYLTRSNIIDLLDRDVVMYDKNFDTKKDALHEAFNCLDVIAQNGVEVKNNTQFITRAKQAYNGLLCTMNSHRLYQEFYRLAVDPASNDFTIQDIENFKIACRSELIAKRKKSKEVFKGTTTGALDSNNFGSSINQAIAPMPQARPAQPQPVKRQTPPAPPAKPAQPKSE